MTASLLRSGRLAGFGGMALRQVIIVGPAVVAILLLGLYQLPRQQRQATQWVNHTLEVLEQTATLEAHVIMAVAVGQSYLLTGDADRRALFEADAARVEGDIAAFRKLTADNPRQTAALAALSALVTRRFELLRSDMAAPAARQIDPASAALLNRGREVGEEIVGLIGTMKAEERNLLAERDKLAHRAAMHTLGGLLACGIAAVGCAAVVAALVISRRSSEQVHLTELRRVNTVLEDKVAERTAELAANQRRLAAYVDHLGDGLVAIRVEPDGRFIFEELNAAAREMLGVGAEALGRDVYQVLPPAQARASAERMAGCVAGRVPVRYGVRFETKAGPRDLRAVVVPVADLPAGGTSADDVRTVEGQAAEEGEARIGLLLATVRDVTREVAMEEQLRQAQRMEAVGQLTAGVAHDFNNHLQTILGSLEVLHERPHPDQEARHCVALAEKAARHGATLSQRLLAFSRKQPPNPVAVKAETALIEVAALLGQTLGGGIKVETSVAAGTWPVNVDDAQLENCLLNLAVNARDAMTSGGMVRLGVGNAGPDEAIRASLPPGEYVRFTVADEGSGMSPETMERVFEPFFTTKEVGKGTGLGLSMVQGFARQSGGDVRLDSTLGVGTTVSLWLPRAVEVAEGATPPDPQESVAIGHGRVMVVDDDPAVGQMLSLFLRRGGYTPFVVVGGEAALEMLRSGAACDLLVADQSMPVMTGLQLIEEVVRLRPAMPAMLVTGYDMVGGLERIAGRVEILRKPFERRAFLALVQTLLNEARQEARQTHPAIS